MLRADSGTAPAGQDQKSIGTFRHADQRLILGAPIDEQLSTVRNQEGSPIIGTAAFDWNGSSVSFSFIRDSFDPKPVPAAFRFRVLEQSYWNGFRARWITKWHAYYLIFEESKKKQAKWNRNISDPVRKNSVSAER